MGNALANRQGRCFSQVVIQGRPPLAIFRFSATACRAAAACFGLHLLHTQAN